MRIGLFDSGVGGLTVLKSFIKYHPNNEYYYYGDTLNVPYGDKSVDELYTCVKKILEYLKEKKVDIIVIACGTVSANLYDRLKEEIDIPIYSVISELPEYMEKNNYKNTLVMATNATINSHIFKKNIKNNIIEVACPKLVPLIEEQNYREIDNALNEYLKDIDGIDSIILGCTHYPIIKEQIENKIAKKIDIIDMGEVLAKKINVLDSFHKIDLYFSKKTIGLDNNVNLILKNCKYM
jgi:glutamate racemase